MSAFVLILALAAQSPPEPCAVQGRVLDSGGRPIHPATVEVPGEGITVQADDRGEFCIAPFQPRGPIQLLVTAPGYQEQISPSLEVRQEAPARVDVTLVRRFTEEVTVTGRADSLVGIGASASEGSIGMSELETRPLLRSTDILEAVPGVAMTQHSTGGHAPIILLRGYNLDHGTDFATFLHGVPLNLPSHAHAQGYSDTNFLIPELIGRIDFQKGPYAAAVGDFGTAGSANIELPDVLPRPFLTLEAGSYDYYRGLLAGSTRRGDRRLLYGAEVSHYDGPSDVPDRFRREKVLLRYTSGDARHGRSLSLFSYGSSWTATDGYPERAVRNGYITRFGTLDPTDGGRTVRHLAIGSWHTSGARSLTRVTGYVQYYDFDLFSNLTFWTTDRELGDQIHQTERRLNAGALVSHTHSLKWRERDIELTLGASVRHDRVDLGLLNTHQRTPVDKHDDAGQVIPAQVVDNRVHETGFSPYAAAHVRWTPWLRTVAGVRVDVVHAQVVSNLLENRGTATAGVASPKIAVVLGPWAHTELYFNSGAGFHSNHANGVVQPVDPADLLVRTRGAEVGVRTNAARNLQSSVSVWIIDSDSELVYAPAAGFTEPERPGRRYGIEWSNYYRPAGWLTLDADAAWSTARYRTDPNGEGRHIPDAINGVVSAGVAASRGRIAGSLRGRYLGPRPLVADGSVFSRRSLVANAQLELQINDRFHIGLDVFNITNREYEDITYYFSTRVRDPRPNGPLESSEQFDFVTHPGEPRTARIRIKTRF